MAIVLTRLYLRASTEEQDATRARADLEAFAAAHNLNVAGAYLENESGASLTRPELFRILADSKPGDILLTEQVDRLSRLTSSDWQRLRGMIAERQVRVIALDLPTSWMMAASGDEFTGRMFQAINGMMLDMLAAISRKDYEDRRRRQAQGIAKAKTEGVYKGRPPNTDLLTSIAGLLNKHCTWDEIQMATKCGRGTIAKVAAELRAKAAKVADIEQGCRAHELYLAEYGSLAAAVGADLSLPPGMRCVTSHPTE